MTDLKTTFAGLSLINPIIISSSGLTNSVGKNKKLAEDGAGAIVLKSLFEEQIMLEADQLKDPAFYPEASDYLEEYIREHKLSEYLTLIKESKKVCPIPIIASINCYTDSEWIDFAKKIEEAGADALEINILALQSELQYGINRSVVCQRCSRSCSLQPLLSAGHQHRKVGAYFRSTIQQCFRPRQSAPLDWNCICSSR